jgi:hypothetical protein
LEEKLPFINHLKFNAAAEPKQEEPAAKDTVNTASCSTIISHLVLFCHFFSIAVLILFICRMNQGHHHSLVHKKQQEEKKTRKNHL